MKDTARIETGAERRWGSSAKASVVDLTFAMWVVAIPLLYHDRLLSGDGDLVRHIVIGRHILETGPRFADPFSFSRAGEPFLAYEWLSQITYASVHGLFGLAGVALLAALLIASALALVVAYIRRAGGDPGLAFVTGAVAAVLTYGHWLARPHLFTFVGTAALLHLLGTPRRILWLAPLFALWANLHPGFLYGLTMIAVWSVGSAIEDLLAGVRPRAVASRLAAPFALALGGSLINPFGWTLHLHALAWMGSETARLVSEFMPLEVRSPNGLFFLAVVGAVVVGLAAQRKWVGWPMLLVFGAGVVAALAIRRNAALFALFALPLAARSLTPVVRELPSWALGRMRAEFERSDATGWRVGAAATALVATLLFIDARVDRVTLVPAEFSPAEFPVAAVANAREAGLQGRLLSHWTWGGYVLKHWPGQLLFVDSMADFFGDDLVREYTQLHHALPGWKERLASRDFSLVLFPPDVPLVGQLRRAPGWHVAHEDDVAVLFVRTGDTDPPVTGLRQPEPVR
jgi:hypothetical protein